MSTAVLCGIKSKARIFSCVPIPRGPSGMFKAIATGGRGFEPRSVMAVPQKLLLEWPISV